MDINDDNTGKDCLHYEEPDAIQLVIDNSKARNRVIFVTFYDIKLINRI